jgi:hypothetical protein
LIEQNILQVSKLGSKRMVGVVADNLHNCVKVNRDIDPLGWVFDQLEEHRDEVSGVSDYDVSKSNRSCLLAFFRFRAEESADNVNQVFSVLEAILAGPSVFSDTADTSDVLLVVAFNLSHGSEVIDNFLPIIFSDDSDCPCGSFGFYGNTFLKLHIGVVTNVAQGHSRVEEFI